MPRTRFILIAILALTLTSTFTTAQQPASRPANLPQNIEFLPNLQYANPDNKPQYLDLYLPKDAKGKLPIIVAIHGGPAAADRPWPSAPPGSPAET